MPGNAISHMVLRKSVVQRDWKLADVEDPARNNGRKHAVTGLWANKERPISDSEWTFEPEGGLTPVLETGAGGLEIATCTEEANQDRHRHLVSTEIYTVLKGTLRIFIDDAGPIELAAGDEIVILPGTVHQVIQEPPRARPRDPEEEPELLVRVHALECHGDEDKYVQLEKEGPWERWSGLSAEEKRQAYKKPPPNLYS